MLHETETNHGKCGKTWYIIPYAPNGTGIFTCMNEDVDVGKYSSPIWQILGKIDSLQCIFQPRAFNSGGCFRVPKYQGPVISYK